MRAPNFDFSSTGGTLLAVFLGALLATELAQDVVREGLAHFAAMIWVSNFISTSGQVMCGLWLASIS